MGATVLFLLSAPAGSWAMAGQAGSESYLAAALETTLVCGHAQSASYEVQWSGGGAATGFQAASPSFEVAAGFLSLPDRFAPTFPVVLGVIPPGGTKDGGQSVQVIGAGFLAAGSGPNEVFFDDDTPAAVQASQANSITAITPVGLEGIPGFENPKGEVSVVALNGNGVSVAPGAFSYQPALAIRSPAAVGCTLELQLTMETGIYPVSYTHLTLPTIYSV